MTKDTLSTLTRLIESTSSLKFPMPPHLIYCMNLFMLCDHYGSAEEMPAASKGKYTTLVDKYFHLPKPPTSRIPKVPKFTLHQITNNPNAHVAPNYNIVDEIV